MASHSARWRPDPFATALVATVLLASLLPARGVFADIVGGFADFAIALIFFLHGAKLSRRLIVAGATNWRLHVAVVAITFAVFPMLGLVLVQTPGLDMPLAIGILFLCAVPSTIQSSVVYVAVAGGSVAAAVCAAALSNVLGVFVTPALTAVLTGAGGTDGVSGNAVGAIFLQLLLPFFVGHLLRPLIGSWVEAHRRFTSLTDRGSILIVVYAAFSASVVGGLWQRTGIGELALVALLMLILLAVSLLLSVAIGRLTRLAREDRVTVLFCGTMKSLAAGVPMAGVLFPPAMVGAVMLPILIFHPVEMVVCAMIARRIALGTARDAPAPQQSD